MSTCLFVYWVSEYCYFLFFKLDVGKEKVKKRGEKGEGGRKVYLFRIGCVGLKLLKDD